MAAGEQRENARQAREPYEADMDTTVEDIAAHAWLSLEREAWARRSPIYYDHRLYRAWPENGDYHCARRGDDASEQRAGQRYNRTIPASDLEAMYADLLPHWGSEWARVAAVARMAERRIAQALNIRLKRRVLDPLAA